MSFLTVGGVVAPVAPDAITVRKQEIGDFDRTFHGEGRSSRTGFKYTWEVAETAAMASSDANALLTQLSCTPPVTLLGDLLGSTATASAYPRDIAWTPVITGSTFRMVLSFALEEA